MTLEIKFNHTLSEITAIRCKFLKTPDLQKNNPETQKGIENPRSVGKTPGLARLAK